MFKNNIFSILFGKNNNGAEKMYKITFGSKFRSLILFIGAVGLSLLIAWLFDATGNTFLRILIIPVVIINFLLTNLIYKDIKYINNVQLNEYKDNNIVYKLRRIIGKFTTVVGFVMVIVYVIGFLYVTKSTAGSDPNVEGWSFIGYLMLGPIFAAGTSHIIWYIYLLTNINNRKQLHNNNY